MPGWMSSLRGLFVEASPLRRTLIVLVAVLPMVALGAAYLWVQPREYRTLYGELSDRAGGEVIAALEQLDIPYRLSTKDGSIEVPSDHLHIARYRLAARGLPRSGDEVQDDAARAPSFGASSLQEQRRFQRALELELARSIQQLEAVELARVHLALPKVSPFLRDAPAATAAVLVRLRPGMQLTPAQVTTIQTLVAASVPRMKRPDVQVFDRTGMLRGEAVPDPSQSLRLALEQDLARRALAVLTPWLGAGRVNVQVTASLADSETRETVERVRSVVVAGEPRPAERTVRTSRAPEGRVQRIQAVVVLGFDASPAEIRRASQMVSEALGLVPARGDRVGVYALPLAVEPPEARAASAQPPVPVPPASIPSAEPVAPPASESRGALASLTVAVVVALAALLLAGLAWQRRRRAPAAAPEVDDFDAMLDSVRDQVLADPRVAADVVKLWMRA